MIAAALACLPAAAIFSTFNLAFYVHQPLDSPTVIINRRVERTPAAEPARPARLGVRRGGPLASPLPAEIRRYQGLRVIADGLVTWYFFFGAWASLYLAISGAGQLRSADAARPAPSGQARKPSSRRCATRSTRISCSHPELAVLAGDGRGAPRSRRR